ncbi:MAG: insulinase family protein [Candidatus Eisenbacteria bacterium]|nr:insulinase family protein [Candidatus Eisenbacteria bacterium]
MKRAPMLFVLALASATSAWAAAPARSTAPPPALPAVQLSVPAAVLPVPTVRVLPNGLRVAVLRDARLPLVQIQLLVPAGGSAEQDSLPGIAALTAGLVAKGTTSRSAAQLTTELEALGATLDVSASRDYAQMACLVRAGGAESALELMSDVAMNSLMDDEEFGELRRLAAQQLGQQRRSATAIADDRVWEAAFRSHPYAHSPVGDIQSLIASRRDVVQSFYRSRWRPDHAVLSISGDVDPERIAAAVDEWFGRWSGKTAGPVAPVAVTHQSGIQVVDLAGARWSEARLAWVGAGRASAELAAWQVLATALEHSGLPAGARVSFQTLRDASLLTVSVGAPTDSIAPVVRRVWEAVRVFASRPPAAATIDPARRELAQKFPLGLETLAAYLSQWQAFHHAGLGDDALARHHERLRAPVDVALAARTLSQPPQILVAGPGDVLREKLAGFGDVTVEPFHRTPIAQVDTLAAPTAEQLRRGKAAVTAAVAAHGGAARLNGAHTTVFEGEMLLIASGQELSGQYSLVRVDPDRMSFATKMLQFESRQVLVGDSAWTLALMDSAAFFEADSAGIAALKASRTGDIVHLLRAAMRSGSQAARRGTETIAGRKCDLVDFIAPDGRRWRFLVDEATRTIRGVDGELGPDLKWHDRRLFSQPETVSGLVLPFIEDRFVDGERVSRFTAVKASVNQPIDSSLFRRPRVVKGILLPD